MNFLKVLTRDEMKNVVGGAECHLYCCDNDGNCSSGVVSGGSATSHEGCQSEGLADGWSCGDGTYLAALYK
ncbi:MAG: hypothetical protein AAFW89_07765 [Bacteroidota bacterium]